MDERDQGHHRLTRFPGGVGLIQEEEQIKRRKQPKGELSQFQPIPIDELIQARELMKDLKRLGGEHACTIDPTQIPDLDAKAATGSGRRKHWPRTTLSFREKKTVTNEYSKIATGGRDEIQSRIWDRGT